uniref:Uncharacterized protein n=1 Tax=Haptolina brevifila TaxID=156173 RepID=A0A7S2GH40_9EUKA
MASGVQAAVAKRRAPGYRARARHQHARMMQQRARAQQVSAWIAQFGKPGQGRLARDELSQLLFHLYPEAGPPEPQVLDDLIISATEVRTYSIHLKGNPHGTVSHDMIMPLVSGYSMYRFASVAFDRRAEGGRIALRDLPALMREANSGIPCEAREIDFVMDCCSSSVGPGMLLDSRSILSRQDVLAPLQVMAMRVADTQSTGPTDVVGGEDALGGNEQNEPANGEGDLVQDAVLAQEDLKLTDIEEEEEEAAAAEWDDVQPHLTRWRLRQQRALRIQAHFRRMTAVKFLHRCRNAAIILQSAARRRAAWKAVGQRRAAALRIGRMAKGRRSRQQAQRRRDAATTIGRVAKGRVTRKLMHRIASTSLKNVHSMVPYRMVASRSRTFSDLFKSSRTFGSAKAEQGQCRKIKRANTAPIHGFEDDCAEVSTSRACAIS